MRLFVLAFCLVVALGVVVAPVAAQTSQPGQGQPGSSTSNPETKADNPTDRRSDPAPQSGPASIDNSPRVTTPGAPDVTGSTTPDRRDDGGSALPRPSSGERQILGMNPTAAVLLAAAMLVVVVLAIVAMARGRAPSTDTRIDIDRRL